MPHAKSLERVPAAPFANWLNQRIAYWEAREDSLNAVIHLLDEIGWPVQSGSRRLYRYRRMLAETRRGRDNSRGIPRGKAMTLVATEYPRAVVEDALHHAGVLFSEVYPEIAAAEDLELEPAKWCPGCREERTPINGQCAFCDWRIGPKTGQKLHGRRLAA
jgi:hypothetical protein